MKTRKPRATKKRIEAAEMYLNIAGTCTVFAEMPTSENSELLKLVKENRKNLNVGNEYLQDLLLWEKDRIMFREKKGDD